VYYQKCVFDSLAKRKDFFLLANCFYKKEMPDSSLVYLNIAAQKGLHYGSLKDLKNDSIYTQNHTKAFENVVQRIKKNTIQYIRLQKKKPPMFVKVEKTDQKYRYILAMGKLPDKKQKSLSKTQKNFDNKNQEWLQKYVTKNGWPTLSQKGYYADNTAWLIVQHADNDTAYQKRFLKIIDTLAKQGETNPANYAYLTDRIKVNSSEKQIYGTQFREVIKDGKAVDLEPKPLEDPDCVNARRHQFNLPTIEFYLQTAKERYIR
jgi:flagellar biosynthesis chaperone FliJ